VSRSIRFLGVAARSQARKRRIDLVREAFRRLDAAAHTPSQRHAGGRSSKPHAERS
jgi:hypothetical protein